MDIVHKSFLTDAAEEEVPQICNLELEVSHGPEHSPPAGPSNTATDAGSSVASQSEPMTNDQQGSGSCTEALLIFVLRGHRISSSVELGVLNEHPEALKRITSNPSLGTSAFLDPALKVVMAELRPLMVVQVAVRLTAISLSLLVDVLQIQPRLDIDDRKDGEQKLDETVYGGLDQALPYYEWQGPRNCHARAQYLMALLEEAVGGLAVPKESLIEALKMDTAAKRASRCVTRSIDDLGHHCRDVLGEWAANIFLSAWPPASRKSLERNVTTCRTPPALDTLLSEAACPEPVVGPDPDSDDELPSLSDFISRRKSVLKSAATEVATSGSRAGISPWFQRLCQELLTG